MNNIEEYVENILTNYPETRNSDELLYARILLKDKSLDYNRISVVEFFSNRKKTKIPPLSTVGRTRRKVQELHPELKGNEQVQKYREELEKEYREYYGK